MRGGLCLSEGSEYQLMAVVFLQPWQQQQQQGGRWRPWKTHPLEFVDTRLPRRVQDVGVTVDEWTEFVKVATLALRRYSPVLVGSGWCFALLAASTAASAAGAVVELSGASSFGLFRVAACAAALLGVACAIVAGQLVVLAALNRALNAAMKRPGLKIRFVELGNGHKLQIFVHKSGTMVLSSAPGSIVVPYSNTNAIWLVTKTPPKPETAHFRLFPPGNQLLAPDHNHLHHSSDDLEDGLN